MVHFLLAAEIAFISNLSILETGTLFFSVLYSLYKLWHLYVIVPGTLNNYSCFKLHIIFLVIIKLFLVFYARYLFQNSEFHQNTELFEREVFHDARGKK